MLMIAGKKSIFRVVRWLVHDNQVTPCCLRLSHSISFSTLSLLLYPPKVNPVNRVFSVFPPCLGMNFSEIRQLTMVHGVKNTVCLLARPPRPPAMSPAPIVDIRLVEHPRQNQNSSDVKNLLQELTILEYGLFASCEYEVGTISVSETASFKFKSDCQLWTWISNELHQLPLFLANGHVVPVHWQFLKIGFPSCISNWANVWQVLPSSLMSRKAVIWSSDLSRGECSLSRSCSDFWTSLGTFSGSLYRHSSTKRFLLLVLTTHNMGVSSKCGRDLNFNSRNVALTKNLYIKEQDPPLKYCVSRVWLQSFDYSGVASILCMMRLNFPILHSRPHRIPNAFLWRLVLRILLLHIQCEVVYLDSTFRIVANDIASTFRGSICLWLVSSPKRNFLRTQLFWKLIIFYWKGYVHSSKCQTLHPFTHICACCWLITILLGRTHMCLGIWDDHFVGTDQSSDWLFAGPIFLLDRERTSHTISSFPRKVEKWPEFSLKLLCVITCAEFEIIREIYSLECPINVIEHRHVWSLGNISLELNWSSIISRQFWILSSSCWNTLIWSFHFSFASEQICIFPWRMTESEYTCTSALAHLITS